MGSLLPGRTPRALYQRPSETPAAARSPSQALAELAAAAGDRLKVLVGVEVGPCDRFLTLFDGKRFHFMFSTPWRKKQNKQIFSSDKLNFPLNQQGKIKQRMLKQMGEPLAAQLHSWEPEMTCRFNRHGMRNGNHSLLGTSKMKYLLGP